MHSIYIKICNAIQCHNNVRRNECNTMNFFCNCINFIVRICLAVIETVDCYLCFIKQHSIAVLMRKKMKKLHYLLSWQKIDMKQVEYQSILLLYLLKPYVEWSNESLQQRMARK